MPVHLHRARQWTGWILGAAFLSPFALCCEFQGPESSPPSLVTGQVTLAGRPVTDSLICLDSGGEHAAFGRLEGDGTFELMQMNLSGMSGLRGRYRAHLCAFQGSRKLPAKYGDPRTSGIEMSVAPGENDFHIDLR